MTCTQVRRESRACMPQGTHGTHSKSRAWHGLNEARMARTQRVTHGTHSKRRSGSKQVWEQAASVHPRLWLTLTNMAHHTRGTTIAHDTDTMHTKDGRTQEASGTTRATRLALMQQNVMTQQNVRVAARPLCRQAKTPRAQRANSQRAPERKWRLQRHLR